MVYPTLTSYGSLLLPYFLLIASILALWIPKKSQAWLGFLVLAMLSALIEGRISLVAVGALVTLGSACFSFYRGSHDRLSRPAKFLIGFAIVALSLLLGSHKFPGFNNWLILPDLALSSDTPPIRLYLNFDKPLIGLLLLAWGLPLAKTLREWRSIAKTVFWVTLAGSVILLGFALTTGYVRLDLKWFPFSWLWLLVNLVFTCVSEEAFFRGFIQRQLSQAFSGWRFGPGLALIVASILFGLAHLAGGWTYAALATVAGLFYGYAYMRTQKIEASIGVHFLINAIHFVAFSYPALIRV